MRGKSHEAIAAAVLTDLPAIPIGIVNKQGYHILFSFLKEKRQQSLINSTTGTLLILLLFPDVYTYVSISICVNTYKNPGVFSQMDE